MTAATTARRGDILRSGPFQVRIDDDLSLRNVTIAERRALDGVMITTRGAGWETSDVIIEDCTATCDASGFTVDFICRHAGSEIDMTWTGSFRARGNRIDARIEGVANRAQSINRAGFVLLHPIEQRGHAVVARSPLGVVHAAFPEQISPTVLFTDLSGMHIDVGDGCWLDAEFEGELFETEDHRNWTDAGWKTYCTPLRIPAPRHLQAGDRIRQRVLLTAVIGSGTVFVTPPASVSVRVGPLSGAVVPRIGSMTADVVHLAARDAQSVASLGLDHLGVELVDGDAHEEHLARSIAEARTLGTPLRLILSTTPDHLHDWVRAAMSFGHPIDLVFALDAATNSSTDPMIASARTIRSELNPAFQVASGTRGYFAELNRLDIDLSDEHAVIYSVSPQVHHRSDERVMDTLLAQPDTQKGAVARMTEGEVHVGPITLRQRLNVHERPSRPMPLGDEAGDDVDPRQHSVFAAVWVLGTVAALAGASSLTLFRTAGKRGIVSDGSQVVSIVRRLASLGGIPLYALDISDQRRVVGLAVESKTGMTVLLGNRSNTPAAVELTAGSDAVSVTIGPWSIEGFAHRSGSWHAV